MKTLINNFVQWLVVSSANPDQVSLTVKGALIMAVPAIIYVAQLLHIGVTANSLTQLIGTSVTILGAVLTVFGILRKVVLTIKNSATSNVQDNQ